MAKAKKTKKYKKSREPFDAAAEFVSVLLAVLKESGIPEYSSKFSNRMYSVWQKIALLALRRREKKSFARFCRDLGSYAGVMKVLDLRAVPHPSTLEKFAAGLVPGTVAELVARTCGRLSEEGAEEVLSSDSTGFENVRASAHYSRVLLRHGKNGVHKEEMPVRKHAYCTIVCVAGTRAVLACHSVDSGVNDHTVFPAVAEAAAEALAISGITATHFVADKGYDSEKNRKIIEEELGMKSVIPSRKGSGTRSGKRRKTAIREFENNPEIKRIYARRSSSETVNWMIKSASGDDVKGKHEHTRHSELLFRSLSHNAELIVKQEVG